MHKLAVAQVPRSTRILVACPSPQLGPAAIYITHGIAEQYLGSRVFVGPISYRLLMAEPVVQLLDACKYSVEQDVYAAYHAILIGTAGYQVYLRTGLFGQSLCLPLSFYLSSQSSAPADYAVHHEV
jgi:hypothetical protein